MEKHPTIVKYYRLTPKAWRHILAMEEHDNKRAELDKLSDDDIMELVKERLES